MKFNFEKNIKKPVEKALLGGAIIASHFIPLESKAQTDMDSIKDLNETLVNMDTLEEEPKSLIEQIDALRIEKIAELKDHIKTLEYHIGLNSNYEEFSKLHKEIFAQQKEDAEKNFKDLILLKEELHKFSEKQIALLIDYLAQPWRDYATPVAEQKNNGTHERFFNLYRSYKMDRIEEKFDKDRKLNSLETSIELLIGDDIHGFQKVVDSMGEEKAPKEKFKATIDELIRLTRLNNTCFKDPASMEKKIQEKWEERESVESLQDEIKENQKELELINVNLNIDSLNNFINTSRQWLLENISSKEYLKKIIEGEGFSIEEAKEIQFKRFERIKNMPFSIDPKYFSSSSFIPVESGVPRDSIKLNAYDLARYHKQSIHEFQHASTRANFEMSEKAKNLYESALLNDEEIEKNIKEYEDVFNDVSKDYWKLPTEIDARKKVLENEMEKLGIKKYGELMTHEHYLKLQELMKQGKLDHNTMQILLITTEDGLLKVLNEIALNQDLEKESDIV